MAQHNHRTIVQYPLFETACHAYADEAAATAHVADLIRHGISGYSVAINAEKIIRCETDLEFRGLVAAAVVKVPDGAGAVLALRMLQGQRSAKVNFPRAVLQAAHELGADCRLAMIGATEESSLGASAHIAKVFPSTNLVLRLSGFVSEDDMLTAIEREQPSLCLLAMGTPKQEQFAQLAVQRGAKCLFVGCGGAFDIMSGHAVRAPQWMVDNYLEWAYRLMQNPSRWRRQTKLIWFAKRLVLAWAARMFGSKSA